MLHRSYHTYVDSVHTAVARRHKNIRNLFGEFFFDANICAKLAPRVVYVSELCRSANTFRGAAIKSETESNQLTLTLDAFVRHAMPPFRFFRSHFPAHFRYLNRLIPIETQREKIDAANQVQVGRKCIYTWSAAAAATSWPDTCACTCFVFRLRHRRTDK